MIDRVSITGKTMMQTIAISRSSYYSGSSIRFVDWSSDHSRGGMNYWNSFGGNLVGISIRGSNWSI